MNYHQLYPQILSELSSVLSKVDERKVAALVDTIIASKEVFCTGAGRSGFQVKGFAMRLMHLGLKSYVVGETCTPNITNKGLLVICSGSGETKSMVNHCFKAKEVGAKVVLITINPESTIAKLADVVIEIPAVSPKSSVQGDIQSIQPMGSLFEQAEGLDMDTIVVLLMEAMNLTSDKMFGRHANME